MTDMPGAESDAAAVTASATSKLANRLANSGEPSFSSVVAKTRPNSGSVLCWYVFLSAKLSHKLAAWRLPSP